MFRAAALMVISKLDLLPHVDFDVAAAIDHAKQVNPAITVVCVSARTGQGLADWYGWLART
jgi:hydrogenase nickel incorporation protein HypB